MNIQSIIIAILIGIAFLKVIINMYKKRGQSSCGCSGCGTCHMNCKDKK